MGQIAPGMVYLRQPEGHRTRVLASDDIEVLSDVWSAHLNGGDGGWATQSLGARTYYDRVPPAVLTRIAKPVALAPLTDDERAVHRPDLPLRVLRKTGWCWSPEHFASVEAFARAASQRGVDVDALATQIVLMAASILVAPQGPKGGFKRTEVLAAENGRGFRGLELMYKLHQVQAPHLRDNTRGAGLYRLGCAKRLPSFYIGGDRDLAEFLGP